MIEVKCNCGKIFHVADKYDGKKGRCPECGAVVYVNSPQKEHMEVRNKDKQIPLTAEIISVKSDAIHIKCPKCSELQRVSDISDNIVCPLCSSKLKIITQKDKLDNKSKDIPQPEIPSRKVHGDTTGGAFNKIYKDNPNPGSFDRGFCEKFFFKSFDLGKKISVLIILILMLIGSGSVITFILNLPTPNTVNAQIETASFAQFKEFLVKKNKEGNSADKSTPNPQSLRSISYKPDYTDLLSRLLKRYSLNGYSPFDIYDYVGIDNNIMLQERFYYGLEDFLEGVPEEENFEEQDYAEMILYFCADFAKKVNERENEVLKAAAHSSSKAARRRYAMIVGFVSIGLFTIFLFLPLLILIEENSRHTNLYVRRLIGDE
jgi:endogenous inhibitor of DNA gyrase (YacG/DUF329 family)